MPSFVTFFVSSMIRNCLLYRPRNIETRFQDSDLLPHGSHKHTQSQFLFPGRASYWLFSVRKFSLGSRSFELCSVDDNRLVSYYTGTNKAYRHRQCRCTTVHLWLTPRDYKRYAIICDDVSNGWIDVIFVWNWHVYIKLSIGW